MPKIVYLPLIAAAFVLPFSVAAQAEETYQQEEAIMKERAEYSHRSPAVRKFYRENGAPENDKRRADEYSQNDRIEADAEARILSRTSPAAGVDTDGFEMGVLKVHNE